MSRSIQTLQSTRGDFLHVVRVRGDLADDAAFLLPRVDPLKRHTSAFEILDLFELSDLDTACQHLSHGSFRITVQGLPPLQKSQTDVTVSLDLEAAASVQRA